MKRLLLLPVIATFAATAFGQNKAPVATQIPDYTAYAGVTRSIDLFTAFTDLDGTAAVRMTTVLGNIDIILYGFDTPITVDNFLRYVDAGYFTYSAGTMPVGGMIHRSEFQPSPTYGTIWGGLAIPYTTSGGNVDGLVGVPQLPPIKSEARLSNVAGTIGMNHSTSDPNSATSEWYINLTNNGGAPKYLDTINGGYTVFGRMVGDSVNVANQINSLPRYDYGYPIESVPLRNFSYTDYTNKTPVKLSNLVTISNVAQIPAMTFTATSNNPAVVDATLSGTFLHLNAKQTGSARISVTGTDLDGASVSQSFNVNVVTPPGRLVNISTRLQVGSDQDVMIGGFIVRGTGSKRLLVRGIGPSLANSGVANPLSDPVLELHDSTGALIATNDNWQTNANKAEITDTGVAPSAPEEAAILTTVPANDTGLGYTAVLRGLNDKNGVGLVEVYDLDAGPGSTILNISTRGKIDVGENVMIGGFFVGGSESKKILIRAIGPSLANQGVTGALHDPILELHDAQGATIDSNDDWQTSSHKAEIQASGVAPTDPKESATYDVLAPGAYTAIVRGGGDLPTGIGLVEVYQLP